MTSYSIPVEPLSGTPALDSPISGGAASASTVSPHVDEQETREPASGKAPKEKPQRACDACRLRRVKCERQPGQTECKQCRKLQISCQESAPKSRKTKRGGRIAEAIRLYGDDADQAPNGEKVESATPGNSSLVAAGSKRLAPLSYTSTIALLSNGLDADALMESLIPALAPLRICTMPLLRWIDIEGEFRAAGSRLSGFSPINQALYTTLAALAARSSSAPFLVGENAPSLLEVGRNASLRQGSTLCQYGVRRDQLAGDLLNVAIRKINENGVFHTPDLRSVVALSIAETLVLVYKEPLSYTRSAGKAARPFSAAAASHLRILAEEYQGKPPDPYCFLSTTWTVIIRDGLIACVTGRALDISSNDFLNMVGMNEVGRIPIPSGAEIVHDWQTPFVASRAAEGMKLMQLWAVVLKMTRSFVIEVSQPTAISLPRLKLDYFNSFWTELKKCRDASAEAVRLAQLIPYEPPEQIKVLAYGIELLIVQAYRIITWRCEPEQLQKADTLGILDTSLEDYRQKLRDLKVQAEEEAFQAARRVILVVQSIFQRNDTASGGYLVYEGLIIWEALLMNTKVAEDVDGRPDYPLHAKIADLLVLREAVAVSGWSNGHILPHLMDLERAIRELQVRAASLSFQPPDSFQEFLNFGNDNQFAALPLPPLPELTEPDFGSGPPATDSSLFSLDELNWSSSSTEWLDAFLAQLQPDNMSLSA